MGEAKQTGLIEAGWQELQILGLEDDSPEHLRMLRAVFMAGATHAMGLVADIMWAIPESGELTEAQVATLTGILNECSEIVRRVSQGDFRP